MSEDQIVWSHTGFDWDGETFRFGVKHTLDDADARWLHHNLAARVAHLPGMEDVDVEVELADWRRDGQSVSVEPGTISFIGLKAPWPDAQAVRQALAEAVRAAHEASELALQEAKDFSAAWHDKP